MPIYNSSHTGIEFDTSINNVLNAVNDGGIASINAMNTAISNYAPTKTGGARAAHGI